MNLNKCKICFHFDKNTYKIVCHHLIKITTQYLKPTKIIAELLH